MVSSSNWIRPRYSLAPLVISKVSAVPCCGRSDRGNWSHLSFRGLATASSRQRHPRTCPPVLVAVVLGTIPLLPGAAAFAAAVASVRRFRPGPKMRPVDDSKRRIKKLDRNRVGSRFDADSRPTATRFAAGTSHVAHPVRSATASGAGARPVPASVALPTCVPPHETVACGHGDDLMSSTTTERELDRFSERYRGPISQSPRRPDRGTGHNTSRVTGRRSPCGHWRIVLTALEGEPKAEMSLGAARLLARQLLTEIRDSDTETRLLGYWREIQIADQTT